VKTKGARPRPRASPLNPGTQAAWRQWLEDHSSVSTGVWLAVFKKGGPPESLRYEQAVEEALCYGWIDGQLQTLDATRFLIWFCPRKSNSIWAGSNKRRVRKLIREGRMRPAGLAQVQQAKRNGQWQAATEREDPDVIHPHVYRGLARHKGALAQFRSLPPSHRRMFLYWIASAKREETKQRRIQQLVKFLAEDKQRFPWDPGRTSSSPAKKKA
jgi:uncharacterized protein YdeI (YjbR/CyaY-like superfamily)